jgi:hypothetical protein
LLYEVEGSICTRFFRRADGTMMTSDCNVGVKRRRLRVVAAVGIAASAAAAVGAVAGAALRSDVHGKAPARSAASAPLGTAADIEDGPVEVVPPKATSGRGLRRGTVVAGAMEVRPLPRREGGRFNL